MVRSVSGILLLVCSFLCQAEFGHYKMGAGDLINISIYDEPDLSLEVRIGLSGQISFPLLGDVKVSGLSPKTLEQKLTSGLKGPYLIDPSVTVSIVEYRPFYITGEVEKPGSYAFHPGLTVDKAITISGGFTERASKGSIFVMQDQLGSDEKKQKKEVELFNTIQPGDVLTVEQSFF
ncbi:MAG: polysaccharide biosynthesis/export family protein [Colwellia sp.]